MITLNLKWFLGLSVTAHAVALVAWQSPSFAPGNTGHTVHLSVVQQAGAEHTPVATTALDSQPVHTAPASKARAAAVPVKPVIPASAGQAVAVAVAVIKPAPAQPQQQLFAPDTAASKAATLASNPVMQRHEADRHLRSSVMQLVTQQLTYPAIARRKGWQGVVRLELHIEADGSITGLQLDETSGYAVLDRAALQCLQTTRIPNAAQWLQGEPADIVVPVEYRLVDS